MSRHPKNQEKGENPAQVAPVDSKRHHYPKFPLTKFILSSIAPVGMWSV